MGTRSLTIIKDQEDKEIAVLYRQYDGNPDSHGQELINFLKGHTITNGITQNSNKDNAFNGANCMAAAIIAHFKQDIGGFYLYPAGTRKMGENYTYIVSVKEQQIEVECPEIEVKGNVESLNWS